MLKAINDDEQHGARAEVLLDQLVKDTLEVLQQYGLFDRAQSQDIAVDLLYRICAVLDGSSFPGRLNGDEISPFVGFYLNHSTETPLVPENGSAMRILVEAAVSRHFDNPASG